MSAVDKFQEFEMFSELVQRLSERRQSASQTYLTVNTAVFGVLAFLAKDAGRPQSSSCWEFPCGFGEPRIMRLWVLQSFLLARRCSGL